MEVIMNHFDPDVINSIAQRHIGKPMAEMADAIGQDLEACYPDFVDTSLPLVFNSGGGIMYQLKIFAMTPHEYIMICGSSIGSSGFSGRHPAAFWDTVLSGEANYMHQDQWELKSYKTGDRIFVDRGQAATIDFPDHCWMLEYSRGTLIWLLPFGIVNVFTNTLDFRSLFQLMKIYASLSRRYFARHPEELQPYLMGGCLLLAGLWWCQRSLVGVNRGRR